MSGPHPLSTDTMTISLVERTQAPSMIDMAGQNLTTIVDGALDIVPGMALPAAIAPSLVHVFDLNTGARR
ncbi:hypothetical protein [uncultured Devosia sp.]|uniref:hypothetical protein n=1 Tax=uncultured Devosia sp. TaxID=211434 RepID=UPI0035C9B845